MTDPQSIPVSGEQHERAVEAADVLAVIWNLWSGPPRGRHPMTSSPTPRVYGKRKGADPIPEGAVYVGRPTQFGNPFSVGDYVTNHEAVGRYRRWLAEPEGRVIADRARRELRGKDLVCWCQSPSDTDPLPCHATVLLEIANGGEDE